MNLYFLNLITNLHNSVRGKSAPSSLCKPVSGSEKERLDCPERNFLSNLKRRTDTETEIPTDKKALLHRIHQEDDVPGSAISKDSRHKGPITPKQIPARLTGLKRKDTNSERRTHTLKCSN